MIKKIAVENRCFIIAEIGLSHEGSLGIAISMIDKAAKCGVDAVKFQSHFPEHESSKFETFRTNGNLQDKTRFDYWERTSFSEENWIILKKHCDLRNVIFLSTPFSIYAAEILQKVDIFAWKISSGDITNYPLLDFVASTRKPILLSTGMSNYSEISDAIKYLNSVKNNIILFQCTNSYPCPPEEIGLNEIPKLSKIGTGISAFTLGAKALEVHITWDKEFYGPDVSSSLTFDELTILVDSIRYIEKSFISNKSKNDLMISHNQIRTLFMKGIYYNKNMSNGDSINMNDLSFKKPLTDIPASEYKNLIGKVLTKNLLKDESLKKSDFNEA